MNKYILIYNINDHPECGGGNFYKFFKEEEKMHQYFNESATTNPDFSLEFAGLIYQEFEYEPVEMVIKYKAVKK